MSELEARICELQKGLEDTAAWMVGEQLKEICAGERESAELLLKDLEQKGMGLGDCEARIKAYADARHKKGTSCVCVTPAAAEKIIREFYGLPAAGAERARPAATGEIIDLADFL
ncbi:MAG: hypothetical protein VB039_05240 [Oscillospiraceae bacterium]|nr:hypothetical protein [Oscillospiraceae bacterium]